MIRVDKVIIIIIIIIVYVCDYKMILSQALIPFLTLFPPTLARYSANKYCGCSILVSFLPRVKHSL